MKVAVSAQCSVVFGPVSEVSGPARTLSNSYLQTILSDANRKRKYLVVPLKSTLLIKHSLLRKVVLEFCGSGFYLASC